MTKPTLEEIAAQRGMNTGTPDQTQPQEQAPGPYIILKDGENAQIEASEQRSALLLENVGSLNMAEIKYALYLDPLTIRSASSVFTGPEFPYTFRWVTVATDSYSSDLRNQAITTGYRPVVIFEDKFRSTLVMGEKALLMAIDRSTSMLTAYRATKTPIPPALPDDLKDKWGTMLTPIVDSKGNIRVGQRMLFYTEKAMVQDRRNLIVKASEARTALNATKPGFLQNEVGGAERPWEFPIPD